MFGHLLCESQKALHHTCFHFIYLRTYSITFLDLCGMQFSRPISLKGNFMPILPLFPTSSFSFSSFFSFPPPQMQRSHYQFKSGQDSKDNPALIVGLLTVPKICNKKTGFLLRLLFINILLVYYYFSMPATRKLLSQKFHCSQIVKILARAKGTTRAKRNRVCRHKHCQV